ncbi:MAG: hypothetical protein IJH31_00115 [Erysipelotrichaceae bacterium]|nr:hypothetical protein [Erysipelotrichaceae bacterium]
MRAPGALLNTHMLVAKALVNNREGDKIFSHIKTIVFHFTSEPDIETLSVGVDEDKIQITFDYRIIERLVKETRKDKRRHEITRKEIRA